MRSKFFAVCWAVVAFHPGWAGDAASKAWGDVAIEAEDSTITVQIPIGFPPNASEVPVDLREAAGARSLEKIPNAILGRIVDEDLQPVSGAELIVSRVAADDTRKQIALANADIDGRFKFDRVVDIEREFKDGIIPAQVSLPNFFIELAARAPDRASTSSVIFPAAIARFGEARLIRMPRAKTIRGRITGPNGNPVQDAVVSVWNPISSTLRPEVVCCGRTDADGNYAIRDVAPFSVKEHMRFEDSLRQRDPEHPEQPLATSRVFVARPLMRIDHPDFAVKVTDIESIPGEKDVQLVAPAVLAGSVVYGDSGEPAAGALVKLASMADEVPPSRDQASSEYGASALTDPEGEYRFENVPPGTYKVWAEFAGWVNVGAGELRLAAQETTTAPVLKLTAGGLVRIRLEDEESGEPLKLPRNAQLVLAIHPKDQTDSAPSQHLTAMANEDGVFEFRVVPGTNAFQFLALEVNGVSLRQDSLPSDVRTIAEGQVQVAIISIKAAEIQANVPADERAAARVERARALILSRKYQAAVEQLKPLVEEHPQLVNARMLLAEAYELSGQVGEAKGEYSRILEGTAPQPTAYLARNNLAFLLATAIDDNLRDGARAARLAEEAISLSEGAVPDVYDTLAAAYAEAGEMERAVEAVQHALKLSPKRKDFRDHLELYRSGQALRIERPAKRDDSKPVAPTR